MPSMKVWYEKRLVLARQAWAQANPGSDWQTHELEVRRCLKPAPGRSNMAVSTFAFPPFTGIRVNMMPFRSGERESLPLGLRGYYDAMARAGVADLEPGKIAYITIDESVIGGDAPQPQRRGGLHLDSPGIIEYKACDERSRSGSTSVMGREGGATRRTMMHWGCGATPEEPGSTYARKGIYMASNVAQSTLVYPFYVPHWAQPCGTYRPRDFCF